MPRFTRILGWCFISFAAIGVAVEIDHTSKGEKSKDRAVGIVMAILFGVGGIRLLKRSRRIETIATPSLSARQVEDAVLASARKNEGRVTVTDVAADTSLTFSEAKAALEQLAKEGACETLMTDNGMLVYNFREIIHAAKKAGAT